MRFRFHIAVTSVVLVCLVLSLVACYRPNLVEVSISPTSAKIESGSELQFHAKVTGSSDTAVVWTVNGITGGAAIMGTISESGRYQAPVVQKSQEITIGAAAHADRRKMAIALIVVKGTMAQ